MQEAGLGCGGTAYYVYNAGGERIRKVIENGAIKEDRLYIGGRWELFRKSTGGTIDTERESVHIYDDQETRIALIDKTTIENGSTLGSPSVLQRFHLSNHLGSSNLELDSSAALISYEEYYPFGSTSYSSGRNAAETSLKRYRYVGKERDDETGLYYYGARYYASWLCRFVSVDPLKDEYPHYTPYQYAGNKPIVAVDKQGRQEEPKVEGYSYTQVPRKLPDNLSEYFLTQRQDLIGDFTKAFGEGSSKEQKREFIKNLQSDFKDYILDQTKISEQDGRYKIDSDKLLTEAKDLDDQGVSGYQIERTRQRRIDLSKQALESTSINSLVFERQKQSDASAARDQQRKLQRELEKLQEIQEAGFLDDLSNILTILGDTAEIVGYGLIISGIGTPIGVILVAGGKISSAAGAGIQIYEDVSEGNYENAGLRTVILIGSEVSGIPLNKAAKDKIISESAEAIGNTVIKLNSKTLDSQISNN
jgi:RHS repeat-associated protein